MARAKKVIYISSNAGYTFWKQFKTHNPNISSIPHFVNYDYRLMIFNDWMSDSFNCRLKPLLELSFPHSGNSIILPWTTLTPDQPAAHELVFKSEKDLVMYILRQ